MNGCTTVQKGYVTNDAESILLIHMEKQNHVTHNVHKNIFQGIRDMNQKIKF